jgi:hypothetical protein
MVDLADIFRDSVNNGGPFRLTLLQGGAGLKQPTRNILEPASEDELKPLQAGAIPSPDFHRREEVLDSVLAFGKGVLSLMKLIENLIESLQPLSIGRSASAFGSQFSRELGRFGPNSFNGSLERSRFGLQDIALLSIITNFRSERLDLLGVRFGLRLQCTPL